MLKILRDLLQEKIDDIDSGNSNISKEEQLEVIDFFQRLNSKEFNKTESADYIGVCVSTFDNYVRKGLIPKGKKHRGSNTLFWNKYNLDKFLKK